MYGIGPFEIIGIFIILSLVYGIFMTVDALRRPADTYPQGDKVYWVILLIVTNPLLSKFYPRIFHLLAILCFIAGSIAYHIIVRKEAPANEIIETDREARMRKRFESR